MADYKIRIPIEADSSKLRSEVNRSKSALGKLKGSTGQFAAGLSSAGGPLGQFSSGLSGIAGGFNLAAVAGGAAALAVSGFAAVATMAAREISKTEVALFKTEAILKATGNASGFTTRQLDGMARAMAMSTLASTDAIRQAQNVLLTFKSITGPQFQKTIELAQDMAAVFGGSASSAATQLGKALEDPATGLTALRRVGVSFTAEQKQLILSLQKTGQAAQAQTEILKVLEQQIGGAGKAEAGGLAGAVDTLGQRWDELMEAWGNSIGLTQRLAKGMNIVSEALGATTADIQNAESANGLFAERLELVMELERQESLAARGSRGREGKIASLKQEIAELGKKLGLQVEIENKETAAQARAQEASQARAQEATVSAQRAEREKVEAQQRIDAVAELQFREAEAHKARVAALESLAKIKADLEGPKSEEEKEREKHDLRIESLQRFAETNLEMAGQANALIEQEQQRHANAMSAIEATKFQAQMSVAKSGLGNLATLMNSSSKKAFQVGKVAAIANATISGLESVVHSYKFGAKIGGPVVGAAFAATAAIATLAQIQQIKSQQFGGGGTVSSGSGGSAPGVYTPPQPTQPIGPQDAGDAGKAVNIIFNGNVNGFDVPALAEQLGEYINQSDTIFIDQNSRTGLQFANAI